mmetsp:Transcript_10518/g.17395  ORF Transcript_10518/g.17395 Transcript_10518/m.17395 type:complete len:85 (+) Transcript_10518:445-699(+)
MTSCSVKLPVGGRRMVPSEARRMALPICPGTESRSIIVEVAAGGAALPATAGDTATDAGGVCGIGDAIIMCNIFVVIVMTDTSS